MAIFIEFDPFLSIRVLRGGHMGGGRCEVLVVPYPIFFESMCSHVYGVKWSPWNVPFEINYLREGGASSQISLISYFFELNSI